MTMSTTTTQSPVLVILPPSCRCPDLERVLKLARKAFDDVALNILDLDLRFAWVAADELQKDKEDAAPPPVLAPSLLADAPPASASAAASAAASVAASAPVLVEPSSFQEPPSIAPASVHAVRLFVAGFAPTLSDDDILRIALPNASISGTTFYPPRPIGPNNAMVRSAAFEFSDLAQAKEHQSWIRLAVNNGSLGDSFVSSAGTRSSVEARVVMPTHVVEGSMNFKRADLFLGTDSSHILTALPAAVESSPWHVTLAGFSTTASNLGILSSVVPRRLVPSGAIFSTSSSQPVTCSAKLTFETEGKLRWYSRWIRCQAKSSVDLTSLLMGSWLSIVTSLPDESPHAIKANAAGSMPKSSSSASPTSLSPSTRPIIPSPKLFFRLNIGNLLDHLTEGQLLGALVPPGVMPVRTILYPLAALMGRPEQSRHVMFEFGSRKDWKVTHDWIKAEAVPGGRIATFLVPNTKVSIIPKKLKGALPAYVAPSISKVNNGSTPASPVKPAVPASFDPLPAAPPEHYCLHISNLKPEIELAEIIPALVPQDVTLTGASLFGPRPIVGGSRHELVRSLKFAFHTESDAKRCQQWIKRDSDGQVSSLVLPGAKIAVGNPMDPMLPDAAPSPESHEPPTRPPSALPAPPSWARPHSPAQTISPASASPTPSLTPSKQPHISIIGIDPTISVPAIFSSILGSLKGPIEPTLMGIRNANGRRGAEFVFDNEATAMQFVLQVWTGIKEGKYVGVTVEGEELKIVKGRSSQSGRE